MKKKEEEYDRKKLCNAHIISDEETATSAQKEKCEVKSLQSVNCTCLIEVEVNESDRFNIDVTDSLKIKYISEGYMLEKGIVDTIPETEQEEDFCITEIPDNNAEGTKDNPIFISDDC